MSSRIHRNARPWLNCKAAQNAQPISKTMRRIAGTKQIGEKWPSLHAAVLHRSVVVEGKGSCFKVQRVAERCRIQTLSSKIFVASTAIEHHPTILSALHNIGEARCDMQHTARSVLQNIG